ncbi:MAG: 3-deoxy-D-manno-octulosonic acid transferase [Planctomycetota bacterium]
MSAESDPAGAERGAPSRRGGGDGVEPIVGDPNPGLRSAFLHLVYDLAWLVAIACIGPVMWWRARRRPEVGTTLRERLGRGPIPPGDGRPVVLLHGVSVGEVKGARSLVDRLREERPDLEVVVSTTTSTGADVARSLYPDLRVVRFPADLSPVVRRFFERVRPVAVVLVELEIWPNFLREANRRGVPLTVVNGRITKKSFGRYRLFKHLFPQFNRISLFCVQNETYAARFLRLRVPSARVAVTGNVKVDGLRIGRVEPGDELRRLVGSSSGRPVVVVGSSHDPEERWACEGWRRAAPDARLVLVPRHPDRAAELTDALRATGHDVQRLSALRAGEAPDETRPVLVDTIGELERVYGLADVVVIGGTLVPHGGQNMLEPAAQGLPVVIGPHVENFRQESALLVDAGGALRVRDAEEAWTAVGRLVADLDRARAVGARGMEAVAGQGGATDLTWRALRSSGLPPSVEGGRVLDWAPNHV